MKLVEKTISSYMEDLRSDSPAPGGGSASALCGAQGAAMIAMVARLTISKKGLEDRHQACLELSRMADKVVLELEKQIDEDSLAYQGMAEAFRLPRHTEDEKIERKKAIEAAAYHAALVPMQTMKLCSEALRLADSLAAGYNKNCASDLGCAVEELSAGINGAYLNVLINSGSSDRAQALLEECNRIRHEAREQADRLIAKVEEDI